VSDVTLPVNYFGRMCGYVIRTKLNMDKFRSLFGAAILALASLPVNAALITTFDNRGDWKNAFSGPFKTETFVDSLQDIPESIRFDGGIVSAASSSTSGILNKVQVWNSTPAPSEMYVGKVGNGSSGSATITWTFPESTLEPIFGFFADFYEVKSLSVWVGNDRFEIPSNSNGQGLTTFGMLSTVSFSEVIWGLGTGADNDAFLIDDFAYVETAPVSAVPVPPALWLFGTGLLGLIGFGRRSKAA